jgi:hypothetical protein
MALLAQTPIGNIGGAGLGPFATPGMFPTGETGGINALTKVTGAISSIVGFMTIAGSIWFMFQLLFGGYEWISSAGDTKKLTVARERIMNGFFGLVIIIAAWIILSVVGNFFGYDILVGKPATIIQQLKLQ